MKTRTRGLKQSDKQWREENPDQKCVVQNNKTVWQRNVRSRRWKQKEWGNLEDARWGQQDRDDSQSLLRALKDGYNLFGCERSNTSQRNIFPVSHWREKQRRRVSGWILIRLERDLCVCSCQQTRSPAASEMVPLTQPWMLFHSCTARFNFRPKPHSLSATLLYYNLIER